MTGFVNLEQRVMTHLCYAHLFGDALDEEALVLRCSTDAAAVTASILGLEAERRIEEVDGFWFLAGHARPDLLHARARGREARERVLQEHQWLLDRLAALPWVHLLALSGSVGLDARGDETAGPDLDLFIVTAPGALSIVRFALRGAVVARRCLAAVGLVRTESRVCANYLTEDGFLEVTNESFFTAHDSLHVQVLKGAAQYRKFIAANPWIARYYPLDLDPPPPAPASPPTLRAAVDLACFLTLAGVSRLRSTWRGTAYQYSWTFRFDRNNSRRRTAIAGGGYQPQIAKRFADLYERHAGPDPELMHFLFPGTTDTGIVVDGTHVDAVAEELGYRE